MLRLHDLLAGRFRVDAEVAEGGMGVVYRGHDLDRDSIVAIKALREGVVDNATRFAREATLLASIDHPGIVRYVAHGVADSGSPYLVMQWLEGTTLAEHAVKVGLTPAEGVAVVQAVAAALGVAHARGVVHRDIKPENIVLVGGDLTRPVVVDFGLARRAFGDQRLTETGAVVGTPGYMAPEQARGERELDARTDVFALGCLLYECLAGVPAFGGRNPVAAMARIVLCDPDPIASAWPAVPPALDRVVRAMMAKQRSDRPADGAAVAAALGQLPAVAGARRRRSTPGEEPATAAVGAIGVPTAPEAAHVIYLRGDAAPAGDLESVVAPHRARIERLLDDVAVVIVDRARERATDAARRAAECTLALAKVVPDATIVLAGPDLEAGADALETADYQRIFARGSPPPGWIRVDATTAAQLRAGFDVREDGGAFYLIARRSIT